LSQAFETKNVNHLKQKKLKQKKLNKNEVFVKLFLSGFFCQVSVSSFCLARFPKKQQKLLKIYRNKIGFINHKNLVKYLSGAFLHRL
jgi:hypothetical protein